MTTAQKELFFELTKRAIEHGLYTREGITTFDKTSVEAELQKILYDNEYKTQVFGVNLFRGLEPDTALQNAEDESQKTYFRNIIAYRDAETIEDCQKIEATPKAPIGFNNLLLDACQLTFAANKEDYCIKLANAETRMQNSFVLS